MVISHAEQVLSSLSRLDALIASSIAASASGA
jgi:hypothetical protein